jgi:hypothetical protein
MAKPTMAKLEMVNIINMVKLTMIKVNKAKLTDE